MHESEFFRSKYNNKAFVPNFEFWHPQYLMLFFYRVFNGGAVFLATKWGFFLVYVPAFVFPIYN